MTILYTDTGYVNVGYIQTGVTVDWTNRIVFIPTTELTLVQSSPTIVYDMDLNELRLILKDLEDDEGMPYVDITQHNTTVDISGITLARVIEFINNYTITLEDGQYSVNFINANSNIADVINPNQVSIRVSNSAGLIHSTSTISETDLDNIAIKVWEFLTLNANVAGSMGNYVTKKLLTMTKFLALK